MGSSNIFSVEQLDGNIFWSQIIPRPFEGGGFLLTYTDNESTELIEFNKILSLTIYSSSKLAYKQILLLLQFNDDDFSVYRFGKFNDADANSFLTWIQRRVLV